MGIIAPEKHSRNGHSQNALARQGVAAVGGIGGGIVMLVLGALPLVFGIAAGVVALVLGLTTLSSHDREDKAGGAVVAAAGAAAILFRIGRLPLIKAAAGTALSIGAFGFIGFGLWNAIKFIKGLKDRRS